MRPPLRLKFEAAFSFLYPKDVSPALVADLEQRLGVRRVESSCNLLGESIAWQGETGEEGLFAPRDWNWSQGAPPAPPDRVLLFQRDWLDGHLHFWARGERTRKGDFSGLEVTASQT